MVLKRQDGFFDGELLDGRRGLIPSNFIQRLQGEDLVEFHRAAVLGLQICGDDSSTTSLPRDVLGFSPNIAGAAGTNAAQVQFPASSFHPHPHQHQQPLPLSANEHGIDQSLGLILNPSSVSLSLSLSLSLSFCLSYFVFQLNHRSIRVFAKFPTNSLLLPISIDDLS